MNNSASGSLLTLLLLFAMTSPRVARGIDGWKISARESKSEGEVVVEGGHDAPSCEMCSRAVVAEQSSSGGAAEQWWWSSDSRAVKRWSSDGGAVVVERWW
ncbi:hypothetical protein Tco_0097175 [Tanacetum coccineum]